MGSVIPPEDWDVPVCYTAMAERGLGSGTAAWSPCPRTPTCRRSCATGSASWPPSRAGAACPAGWAPRRALELAARPGLARRPGASSSGSSRSSSRRASARSGSGSPGPVRRSRRALGDRIARRRGARREARARSTGARSRSRRARPILAVAAPGRDRHPDALPPRRAPARGRLPRLPGRGRRAPTGRSPRATPPLGRRRRGGHRTRRPCGRCAATSSRSRSAAHPPGALGRAAGELAALAAEPGRGARRRRRTGRPGAGRRRAIRTCASPRRRASPAAAACSACEEVQGQFVYGIEGRGARGAARSPAPASASPTATAWPAGRAWTRCPTGAITDRDRLDAVPARAPSRSRPAATAASAARWRSGSPADGSRGSAACRDAAVNRGHLCLKGRYAHGWQASPGPPHRAAPARRRGELRPVSWETAIALASPRACARCAPRTARTRSARSTSSRSTNEACYLLQKLVRAVARHQQRRLLRPRLPRLHRRGAAHGHGHRRGQRLLRRHRAGARHRGRRREPDRGAPGRRRAHPPGGARAAPRCVVIDPRRTELAEWRRVHLAAGPRRERPALQRPGPRAARRAARSTAPTSTSGPTGLDALRRTCSLATPVADAPRWPASSPRRSRAAADVLAGGPALFVHGLGLSELTQGVDSVRALANLGLLTGSIGRPGAGMLPLRGQNNVQGSADMGCMPDLVTGYQPLDDPAVRARLGAVWGARAPRAPGPHRDRDDRRGRARRAARALGPGRGPRPERSRPDAASSRALGAPRPAGRPGALPQRDRRGWRTSCCPRRAGSSRTAPSPTPSGASSACARRCHRRARRGRTGRSSATSPRALGAAWDYGGPADVMDEIARGRPAPLRRRAATIASSRDGLQWPCPAPDHPGTPRLHLRRLPRGPAPLAVARLRAEPRARRGRASPTG